MICPGCGWECKCWLIHTKVCDEKHTEFLKKMNESDAAFDIFGFFSGSAYPDRRPRCESCEEPVNDTQHVCNAKTKSVDAIDFIIDLFRKKDDK